MKKIYNILTLFFLGCILLVSCEKFLDVNQNPAIPTDAPADIRFRAMIDLTYQTKHAVQMQAARMCQYWNYTGANSGSDWFQLTNYTTSYLWWYALYVYQGGNVAIAIKDAESKEAWHVAGAIKTFNAYAWLMTTDWMGDIPLNDAYTGTLSPKYDNQKLIYEYVDKLCDEALVYLRRTNNDDVLPLSKAEYIYNGDVTKWIKFTYLIKARCALHLYPYKVGLYDLDKVVNYCNQSFTSNSDDFRQNSQAGSNIVTFKNYWCSDRQNLNSYRQSQRIVDLLNGNIFRKDDGAGGTIPVVDPRLEKMFYPSADGNYWGIVPPTGNRTGDLTIPSVYGKIWSLPEYKSEIATYAEVQFIKAEACFNKGDLNSAFTAFQQGIRSHMQAIGVATSDIDAYLNSGAIATSATDITLAQIMTQKNIAMFLLAEETWTDFRRYDYDPTIFLGLSQPATVYSEMKNQWPRRFTYLQYSEFDYNRAELRNIEAITETDAAYYPYYYKRVWWNRAEDMSDKEYKVTPVY